MTARRAPNEDAEPGYSHLTLLTHGTWKPRFLLELQKHTSVAYACERAGISRPSAYEARKKDPEFAAQWDDAIQHAVDLLERRAFLRASRDSDVLMKFLLSAHRPALYRETVRQEITGVDGGPVLLAAVAHDRARLADAFASDDDAGGAPTSDSPALAGDGEWSELPESTD